MQLTCRNIILESSVSKLMLEPSVWDCQIVEAIHWADFFFFAIECGFQASIYATSLEALKFQDFGSMYVSTHIWWLTLLRVTNCTKQLWNRTSFAHYFIFFSLLRDRFLAPRDRLARYPLPSLPPRPFRSSLTLVFNGVSLSTFFFSSLDVAHPNSPSTIYEALRKGRAAATPEFDGHIYGLHNNNSFNPYITYCGYMCLFLRAAQHSPHSMHWAGLGLMGMYMLHPLILPQKESGRDSATK